MSNPEENSAVPDAAPEALPSPPRGVVARAKAVLGEHFAILAADRLTWFATLTAAVVLTVSRYHASTGEYRRLERNHFPDRGGLYTIIAEAIAGKGAFADGVRQLTVPVAEYAYWFTTSLFLFFVVPMLLARVVPGVRGRDLGAGLGDWRYGLKAAGFLYLVMLPFVVAVSFTPAFANHYPLSSGATNSWRALLLFELCYWGYFIGWEFVYRGLLCAAIHPRVGAAAILLHTIPFAVMHAGKPEAEAYGSIIAGLALGVVAVRARSFWYGALLHAAVAFTMDVLAMTQTHRWPKVW